MADDVTLPGTGAVVATDDVGGKQYQRIKLDLGGNGLADPAVGSVPVTPGGFTSWNQELVVVGTSAVALPTTALTSRKTLLIQADSANAAVIYVGESGVTADTAATGGIQLSAGQSIALDVGAGVTVYGRSTSATQRVRIAEFA
jgi:hypothetical protein